MSEILTPILGFAGIVVTAWASLLAGRYVARMQAKSSDAGVNGNLLVAATEKWQAIAEALEQRADRSDERAARAEESAARAEEKANAAHEVASKAHYESTVAREQNERLEADVLGLVDYLLAMWAGVLAGTVPPALPIPDRLRHLLKPSDFGSPTD